MKESTAALRRPEKLYEPAFNYEINIKCHIEDYPVYSLPFDYDNASDERLVGLYVNNHDEEAFNRIVNRYSDIIMGFAMKLSGNSHDAEEIKQDVFLILATKLHTFKGNSKFSTWLYKVTLNTCYKFLNESKKKTDKEIHIDSPDCFETQFSTASNWAKKPDEVILYQEMMEVINNAAGELTRSNKTIFHLKDIKGFSNQEVGEFTGLSISAVKSRVLRTRLALREKISSYFQVQIT
jgi:RNA polymerase sigma-70 factor (ECF subfamily)